MRITKEAIILSAISIIFIFGMGYLIWHSSGIKPAAVVSDLSLLSKTDSHMTGKPTAKVTLVEFGDYQCPACGIAYPMIKQVTDAYASNPNFNFVFRNFPLPQHPNAPEAAEAAEAAGAQGKYWQMHDMLYSSQSEWVDLADPTAMFAVYATKLSLDVPKFTTEIKSKKYDAVISSDQSDGTKAGVDATPTLYVNGTKLNGYSAAMIKTAIDAALAK
jgi:protein-disulfide isomerase